MKSNMKCQRRQLHVQQCGQNYCSHGRHEGEVVLFFIHCKLAFLGLQSMNKALDLSMHA